MNWSSAWLHVGARRQRRVRAEIDRPSHAWYPSRYPSAFIDSCYDRAGTQDRHMRYALTLIRPETQLLLSGCRSSHYPTSGQLTTRLSRIHGQYVS